MKPVRFHRDADQELAEAQEWYSERSEGAGDAFALEIDHALRSIRQAPLRWPLAMRGARAFVLDRFPYTVFYRIRTDHVVITAIAHQSRRPGYWRYRK
jgi:plasmid stabilization system protein ParE